MKNKTITRSTSDLVNIIQDVLAEHWLFGIISVEGQGTMTELHTDMLRFASKKYRSSIPTSANTLRSALNRDLYKVRAHGISVKFSKDANRNGTRLVTLKKTITRSTSDLVNALKDVLTEHGLFGSTSVEWQGTMTELHTDMLKFVSKKYRSSIPKSASALRAALNR